MTAAGVESRLVVPADRTLAVATRAEPPTVKYRSAVRLIGGAFTLALLAVPVASQTPRLGDVVLRLDRYLQRYEEQLANVVAEEAYRQWVEQGPATGRSSTSRMLRSHFALTLTSEHHRWVGYRDLRGGRCSGARPR
jgi:hypothetical protein